MKSARLFEGRLAIWLFILIWLPSGLQAQVLLAPKGPVILTVSGKIERHNVGNSAEFDADMLDRLPQAHFATTTPWHKTPAAFTGAALKTLLETVGAQGKTLRMIALDKYEVSVPVADAIQFSPMLARRLDGKELTIRTLGPVFMIYPFDLRPELKSDVYFGRSIYQLRYIVVE